MENELHSNNGLSSTEWICSLLSLPFSSSFSLTVSVFIVIATTIAFLISWNERRYKKLINEGLQGPKPLPIFGSMPAIFKKGMHEMEKIWLKEYNGLYGWWFGQKFNITTSDQDILSEILVKDFSNFCDRRKKFLAQHPISLGIFFMKGERWKKTRSLVTPTFSSRKLRLMSSQIRNCATSLCHALMEKEGQEVDIKLVFSAFTMEVIALTGFSIQTDAVHSLDHPLVQNAREMFQPNKIIIPFLMIKDVLGEWMLDFMKMMGISFFQQKPVNFLSRELKSLIDERRGKPSNTADFLQLMIDAEEDGQQGGKKLTEDEILGQCFLFWIAGFETTATTLSFAAYLLALHPEVQENIYDEITNVLGDRELNYETVQELEYTEAVMNETLRMYPPLTRVSRLAMNDVTVKGVHMPKYTEIIIPISAIHMDPDIYPEPEAFKPERFVGKKVNSDRLDFLPFGYGPRVCIGQRLATMEVKMALVEVIRKARFVKGDKTEVPLKVQQDYMSIAVNPIMVKIEARDKVKNNGIVA